MTKTINEWMTPGEVQEYLNVLNLQHVDILVKNYNLPYTVFSDKEKAHRRFYKEDVDNWLEDPFNQLVVAHLNKTIYELGFQNQSQMARKLRVNFDKLKKWREEGCPVHPIGNVVYFKPDEVTEWLRQKRNN